MEAVARAASVSGKTLLSWVRMIKEGDNLRYYFTKAVDQFLLLPSKHQYGLLKFVLDGLGETSLVEKIEDNTQYVGVLRSLLFYHSGKKELDQPCRESFAAKLAQYYRSSLFRELEKADPEDFKNELENI